jgi:hypothetical protein
MRASCRGNARGTAGPVAVRAQVSQRPLDMWTLLRLRVPHGLCWVWCWRLLARRHPLIHPGIRIAVVWNCCPYPLIAACSYCGRPQHAARHITPWRPFNRDLVIAVALYTTGWFETL